MIDPVLKRFIEAADDMRDEVHPLEESHDDELLLAMWKEYDEARAALLASGVCVYNVAPYAPPTPMTITSIPSIPSIPDGFVYHNESAVGGLDVASAKTSELYGVWMTRVGYAGHWHLDGEERGVTHAEATRLAAALNASAAEGAWIYNVVPSAPLISMSKRRYGVWATRVGYGGHWHIGEGLGVNYREARGVADVLNSLGAQRGGKEWIYNVVPYASGDDEGSRQ